MALGDVEYEPPYEPPQRYDPNKPYDSIRIAGAAWLKLDAFGVLAIPLRLIASSLSSGGVRSGFLNDSPFIGDIDKQADYFSRAPTSATANLIFENVNKFIPSIVKQGIKAGMHQAGVELDLQSFNVGFKTGIGRKIERQYGLDGNASVNDWLGLVFNRLKIAN
jgi:hypothetical protein